MPRNAGSSERHAEHPPRSRLVLRAIWWRAGSSAAFLAVAVAAVVAATVGPMYVAAADETILSHVVASNAISTTGVSILSLPTGRITLSRPSSAYQPPGRLERDVASVPGGVGRGGSHFAPPIVTVDVSATLLDPRSEQPDGIEFVSRTGVCRHLHLVEGVCPTKTNQVVVSSRTARELEVTVGDTLRPSGTSAALEISGLFSASGQTAPYWWGENYFPFGTMSQHQELLDDGFMTQAGAVQLARSLPTSDWVQLALRPESLSPPSLPALESGLRGWARGLERGGAVVVATRLYPVLARIESEEHVAQTIVAFVSVELLVLALFVLYFISKSTSALRAPDVRVAELRGLRRRHIARIALQEPLLLLAVAGPLGVVVAYALLRVSHQVLFGIASPQLDSLTLVSAVAAVATAVVAVLLASRGLANQPIDEPWSTGATRRALRSAAVLDALGFALSIAGVAELASASGAPGTSAGPLVYLAPGFIALGTALLIGRLLPAAARLIGRAYRYSRAVATLLAVHALARRDPASRRLLIPTIATSLVVFGVATLTVAAANRSETSRFVVGSPVVLDVRVRPGTNFVDAVRAADPTRREAMAAAEIETSYGDALAVDSTRFAAVATWPSGLSAYSSEEIARLLHPPAPPPRLAPPNSHLLVSIDLPVGLRPRPTMILEVFDESTGEEGTLDAVPLRAGRHVYSVASLGYCTDGCRIDAFSFDWARPRLGRHPSAAARAAALAEERAASDIRITLSGMRAVERGTTRSVPLLLSSAAAWRGQGGVGLSAARSGLTLRVDFGPRKSPSLAPVDLPRRLPVVTTSAVEGADSLPGGRDVVQTVGLDGAVLDARARAVVADLPRLGPTGSLMDLSFAEAEQSGAAAAVRFQVWCRRPPSAALLRRLRAHGVAVLAREDASTVLAGLNRSGPSLGFESFGLAAAIAGLLAVGSLLFSVSSDARARRVELAGLHAIGVRRRVLVLSLLVESSVVSAVGALCGTAAAALATELVLRYLPEFATGQVTAPLVLTVPWAVVLVTGAAAFVVLEVAALVANAMLVSGVRPELLRVAR